MKRMITVMAFGLSMVTQARVKVITCNVDRGGIAELMQFSEELDQIAFEMQEKNRKFIDPRITSVLQKLGVIPLTQHVTAIRYVAPARECKARADLFNMVCSTQKPRVELVLHSRDKNGVIYVEKRSVELSAGTFSSSKSVEGIDWNFRLSFNGITEKTGPMELLNCQYGESVE